MPSPAAKTQSEAYLKRNQAALNASIEKAHADFRRGVYFTREQVVAAIDSRRKHRKLTAQ